MRLPPDQMDSSVKCSTNEGVPTLDRFNDRSSLLIDVARRNEQAPILNNTFAM